MNHSLVDKTRELVEQGQPYAVATVVWVERPTSAKPGAKAVITSDGDLTGWIGGSCAEPTVKREARKVLEDGQPRLVRLCPPEKRGLLPQEGVTEVTLTCISGGTLEIFIEPMFVQPQLLIIGHFALAEALAVLGKDLDFSVTVTGLDVSPGRFPRADRVLDSLDFTRLEIRPDTSIVVASHGNYDEEALAAALQSEASYVALVASRSRAQAVVEYLRSSGMEGSKLARLKFPAGLDIGAVTPEEIALSILAEIVQFRRSGKVDHGHMDHGSAAGSRPVEAELVEAQDPVCGMAVEIASARYFADFQGKTYYFCCSGCLHAFEAEPDRFLAQEGTHAD